MEPSRQQHNIDPVWSPDARVLILGSFPSVKSREAAFFYGHPQNRFWKVMATVLGEPVPVDVPTKKAMLLRHGIALWDVLASCDIQGASDASIRNPVANDLSPLLAAAPIRAVFTNGSKAFQYYNKLIKPQVDLPVFCLPSTSPANARCSLASLAEQYRVILPYLESEEEE